MGSVRKKPSATQNDDTDDYWSSSGWKPFNFDDEDPNEEDSIDVIRWDGSKATPIRPNKPVQHSVKHSTQMVSSSPAGSVRYHSSQKNIPSQFPPSPATFPSSAEPKKSKSALEPKTISDAVAVHIAPTATNLAKLEAEVGSLRRQLAQAKRDKAAAPSKSDTLRCLMTGDVYYLELYKSKDDKAALLDGAIERHDGNAIVAATLFMRDTLKRDLFSKELMKRSVAVDHYCAYLRAAGEIDELHETLSALGRNEEAAMLKYRQCLSTTSASTPEIRQSGLKDCVKYYFDCDLRLANETSAIQEQIRLLQRQSVVDDADDKAEKGRQVAVFQSHPRKYSLLHQPVITTLYYCCYYHWGEAEGLLSSPTSIRNQHRINEKQFLYPAIAALCRMRRWRDLETLLTAPGTLFRSSRLSAVIGFDRVVDVLKKNLAPSDALEKYCAVIENSEKRLEMATKLNCYKVAIDTIVQLRDKQRLMSYLNDIPDQNAHMRQYLINQSNSKDIKWRN